MSFWMLLLALALLAGCATMDVSLNPHQGPLYGRYANRVGEIKYIDLTTNFEARDYIAARLKSGGIQVVCKFTAREREQVMMSRDALEMAEIASRSKHAQGADIVIIMETSVRNVSTYARTTQQVEVLAVRLVDPAVFEHLMNYPPPR